MPRKTGYLANVFNIPPLVFRFQYNPEVLAEKKSFKYEQAANFGRFAFDKTSAATGGNFATAALAKLGGVSDDLKEIGSILTATRPLEAVEGEPRVFQIDFALDTETVAGDERPGGIIPDLEILRSFMNPGLDAFKTISEVANKNVPCYSTPPECTLKYGGLAVTCVMTGLNIKMTEFAEDGTPSRAECTVTLKEQPFAIGAVIDTVVRAGQVMRTMGRPNYGEDYLYASPAGAIASLF